MNLPELICAVVGHNWQLAGPTGDTSYLTSYHLGFQPDYVVVQGRLPNVSYFRCGRCGLLKGSVTIYLESARRPE